MITAVINTRRLRYNELHENEVPIAMLAAEHAELNRDKKARKKPFLIDEFYCYPSSGDKDKIDAIYGITALQLIADKQFPVWALFVYKELKEAANNASNSKLPDVLCFKSQDAILIAPKITDCVCKCMLIAMESASNRIMQMESPCGKTIKAKMPQIDGKVVAIENCYLDVF